MSATVSNKEQPAAGGAVETSRSTELPVQPGWRSWQVLKTSFRQNMILTAPGRHLGSPDGKQQVLYSFNCCGESLDVGFRWWCRGPCASAPALGHCRAGGFLRHEMCLMKHYDPHSLRPASGFLRCGAKGRELVYHAVLKLTPAKLLADVR